MGYAVMFAAMLCGCQGPMGDPGPQGPPGGNGIDGKNAPSVDLAGVDLAGQVQPQGVTCSPGGSFCASNHVALCTLSGADAFLGSDCGTQGSMTNPASCTMTGCPAGQTACCRRQRPWRWNFTQPALVGESYFAGGSPGIGVGKSGCGSSLALAGAVLYDSISACPAAGIFIEPVFNRAKVNSGIVLAFPTDGMTLTATVSPVTCGNWTGTMRIDSDLPDWSVTINATCTEAGKTNLRVIGTMSGSE